LVTTGAYFLAGCWLAFTLGIPDKRYMLAALAPFCAAAFGFCAAMMVCGVSGAYGGFAAPTSIAAH